MSKAWFYKKNVKYIVFSERVKQFAIAQYAIPTENISIMPFLTNPKFYAPFNKADEKLLLEKHNIPQVKKVVLLAGDGLPHSVHIVQQLLRRKLNFTLLVVCGKDTATKKT